MRDAIVDYLQKQFYKYKVYEQMPENDHGYEYIPRESLYKIVDGLIPMLKAKQKLNKHSISGKRPDFEAMIKALEQMPDDKLDKLIKQVEAACASDAVDKAVSDGNKSKFETECWPRCADYPICFCGA